MERFEENQFILTGWSIAGEETECKVLVDGTPVSAEVHWKYRKDVVDVIPELSSDAKCGFEIYVPDKGGSKLTLELSADGRESTYVAALDKIRHGENGQDTANIFQKTLRYWKNYGLKNTIKKVCQKLSGQRDYGNYEDFLKKYGVKEEELARPETGNFLKMAHVSRLQFLCTRQREIFAGNDRIGTGTDIYQLGTLSCGWKRQGAQPSICCRGIYCKR